MLAIPFISAICYLAGGQWNKWYRWGMGLPIGVIALLFNVNVFTGPHWWQLLCIPTYFIATNAFSYGEKMWTTKLFGPWVAIVISGVAFGLASAPILLYWSVAQAIIGGVGFAVIKYFDDKGKLVNPWTELLRGFIGTVLLAFN